MKKADLKVVRYAESEDVIATSSTATTHTIMDGFTAQSYFVTYQPAENGYAASGYLEGLTGVTRKDTNAIDSYTYLYDESGKSLGMYNYTSDIWVHASGTQDGGWDGYVGSIQLCTDESHHAQ